MEPSPLFVARYRHRIFQVLEVAMFVAFGLLFYAHGPFWIWHDAINASITVVVVLGCFVLYVAVRGQYAAANAPDHRQVSRCTDDLVFKQYQVPRRFSLRAIIMLTLIMALMNVLLRALDAPPIVSMCVMGLVAVVSTMQAVLERVPRMASMLAGSVFGAVVMPNVRSLQNLSELWLPFGSRMDLTGQVLTGVFVGAFLGYVSGTFAAGVFLIGDSFGRWSQPATTATELVAIKPKSVG